MTYGTMLRQHGVHTKTHGRAWFRRRKNALLQHVECVLHYESGDAPPVFTSTIPRMESHTSMTITAQREPAATWRGLVLDTRQRERRDTSIRNSRKNTKLEGRAHANAERHHSSSMPHKNCTLLPCDSTVKETLQRQREQSDCSHAHKDVVKIM